MKKFNLSGGFVFSRAMLILTSLFLGLAFNAPFLILLGIALAIILPRQFAKSGFSNIKMLNKALCAVTILSFITSGILLGRSNTQVHNKNVATQTSSTMEKNKEEDKSKLEQEEKDKKENLEKAKKQEEEKKLAEEAKRKQQEDIAKQKQIEEQKVKAAVAKNSQQSNGQSSENQGVMVWLSETGDKYHSKPNCGRMNPKNARQVDLSSAKKSYAPCKKCHPPV
ncbi:hypothetical protein [Clostridium frigidicarnis]|uniref:Uncharacterized protein n=1 Tax=Clostridium frigidicarnis TaxID=84698 RepID=A0A1I0V5B6_9CLOT|nr:hypothetical protein [Clostridium frigidicarnis]SFA71534.1 hypothetical protein SAMN04488528_1001168 [Clostridium frigidicarnis]